MIKILSRMFRERRGATSIEYGLICALIVVAVMVSIRQVGGSTASIWQNVVNKVSNVMN